jgi:16S rRNA (uracil1498-N3)-methyltransferase
MSANLPVAMDPSITSPRLFVSVPLHAGATVVASPAQAHHLGTVLRRGEGDAVRLFNGADGEWAARIAGLRRDRCVLAVGAGLRGQAPEADVWLAFAPLKRDATDLVAEKATELGAAALLPVITGRTVAARVNLERMAAIATAAAEQCERLTVPRIAAPVSLPTLPVLAGRPTALLVGPEGGFTDAELDLLDRRSFVVAAGLGPRILRAETAAIVGLALLVASTGG